MPPILSYFVFLLVIWIVDRVLVMFSNGMKLGGMGTTLVDLKKFLRSKRNGLNLKDEMFFMKPLNKLIYLNC